ncbi:hypothetical protein [Pseudonocardia sp. KRD291]|nr:hypothetical protein [Pseudonocardia sp. KRD291]
MTSTNQPDRPARGAAATAGSVLGAPTGAWHRHDESTHLQPDES